MLPSRSLATNISHRCMLAACAFNNKSATRAPSGAPWGLHRVPHRVRQQLHRRCWSEAAETDCQNRLSPDCRLERSPTALGGSHGVGTFYEQI